MSGNTSTAVVKAVQMPSTIWLKAPSGPLGSMKPRRPSTEAEVMEIIAKMRCSASETGIVVELQEVQQEKPK